MSKNNQFKTGKFITPPVSMYGINGKGINDKAAQREDRERANNEAKNVAACINSATHLMLPMVELFEATSGKY